MTEMLIGLGVGALIIVLGVCIGAHITYKLSRNQPIVGKPKVTIVSRDEAQLAQLEQETNSEEMRNYHRELNKGNLQADPPVILGEDEE